MIKNLKMSIDGEEVGHLIEQADLSGPPPTPDFGSCWTSDAIPGVVSPWIKPAGPFECVATSADGDHAKVKAGTWWRNTLDGERWEVVAVISAGPIVRHAAHLAEVTCVPWADWPHWKPADRRAAPPEPPASGSCWTRDGGATVAVVVEPGPPFIRREPACKSDWVYLHLGPNCCEDIPLDSWPGEWKPVAAAPPMPDLGRRLELDDYLSRLEQESTIARVALQEVYLDRSDWPPAMRRIAERALGRINQLWAASTAPPQEP